MGSIHNPVKLYRADSDAVKTPASLRLLPNALQSAIFAFADQTAHVAREAVAVELLEYQQHADTVAEDNERIATDVVQRDEQLKWAADGMIVADRKGDQLESELAAAREQTSQERTAVQQAAAAPARVEQRLEEVEKCTHSFAQDTPQRKCETFP